MVLYVGELEHAMSASSCTSSSHHIGILMSGAGRFLACIHCHLKFEFPAGAHHDTVAEKFESHSCSVPIRSNCDAPVESTRHG